MKSALRSVKPYWFYLICEGIKKVEVGKTAPQSDEWDGIVYLYCSKDKKSFNRIPEEYREKYRKYLGTVGAKFVCDKIIKTCGWRLRGQTGFCAKRTPWEESFPRLACLTIDEIVEYAGGEGREVSGWHISDLKIYDTPRELEEFRLCNKCEYGPIERCMQHEYSCNGTYKLTRPPMSWHYI